MDYLLAAIVGFGIMSFALIYIRNSIENRYYKDYFFVLGLLSLACCMTMLFNAQNFTTQTDTQSYTDLITNITAINQTESYIVPAAVQNISGTSIIILIASVLFIVVLMICGYLFEVIQNLFKKDGRKGTPERIARIDGNG